MHVTTASNWPAYCRASSLLENVKLYEIKVCARLVIGSGQIPETTHKGIATWTPSESARYVWNGLLKTINRPRNFVVGHALTFNLSQGFYAVAKKRKTIASQWAQQKVVVVSKRILKVVHTDKFLRRAKKRYCLCIQLQNVILTKRNPKCDHSNTFLSRCFPAVLFIVL